ncbi:protein disulfide-isomerase precursor [Linnemannia gamsii]|uniref:protein disulfide-isomerase n=1 Tax=Linnemannia gamsii TaxID=64522 RepID=A0ABQ7JXL8_9FUNG|nr:protein disulfide-isomerase precursor [Linnemannia gamsii]
MHNARPTGSIGLVMVMMALTAAAAAAWNFSFQVMAATSSNVLQLTADSFYPAIHGDSLVMVQFYAPWCKLCQSLAPEYEMAASRLKISSSEVVLAKIDCVSEDPLCDAQDVKSYPTLKIYRGGQPRLYSGELKAGAIVSFLQA